ncbi:MAG: dipeptidase PepE [Flavobacteriales bacterium]|nr:dipeptidase PepE [Flavobacteriales bacterium]
MELLLLSNSTLPGEPFFTWPRAHVATFLQGRQRVAFVPFAAAEEQQDAYAEKVAPVFADMGVAIVPLHCEADPAKALETVDAVAVGGGNSFLLLRQLYRTGLVRAIGERVRKGLPYLGWSAGANVACPSIMTTNDMPIVEVPTMRAMNLVPFQINPHFTEDTIPGHGGESREQRIGEFLALNPAMPVVGLREGSLLKVEGNTMTLAGGDMKVFRAGQDAKVVADGSVLRCDLRGL